LPPQPTGWRRLFPASNALNVYPVPDGDCGTNMLFTMRASLAEAAQVTDNSVSSVAQAMAKGALMGAGGIVALSCHRFGGHSQKFEDQGRHKR